MEKDSAEQTTLIASAPLLPKDQPFRFFDNREKYLLFVTTTSEKAVTAERVGREFERIQPKLTLVHRLNSIAFVLF